MRISYRTHPVLGLIDGHTNNISLDSKLMDVGKITSSITNVFNKYKSDFLKNVVIVSDSFIEAASACNGKMIDNELYKEIGDLLTGVLLFGKYSVVYRCKRTIAGGIGAWELNIVEFFDHNALRAFCWEGYDRYLLDEKSGETPVEAAKDIWSLVQMVLMFKKFAQVEIKELPAGQIIKGIDCKYANDTKSNVTFLTMPLR